MKLTNVFSVGAPVEQAWALLADVPRVAGALPGATIDPEAIDGAYRGRLRIKLGPVTTEYEGLAELQEWDDDEHVARFYVRGRETRGKGTAAATITNRLAPENGGTQISVETEFEVTGRAAQFGRGLMEDVAASMLAGFAKRLELELAGVPAPPVAAEALDLGAAAWRPLAERARFAAAVFALGFLAGLLVRRR